MSDPSAEARIEADPTVPIIRITRDFAATPAQVFQAHVDPNLFIRWVGPDRMRTTLDYWDARTGGSWRYMAARDGKDFWFHGCFHELRTDRIVQTFTWEGDPDEVALQTLTFTSLGTRRTRLRTDSLSASFHSRDAWLRSGMRAGVHEGYAKLDRLLVAGGSSATDPLPPTHPRSS